MSGSVLSAKQRNFLYLLLKAVHDTRMDGAFNDKEMHILDSIFHDLKLHYNSADEESK